MTQKIETFVNVSLSILIVVKIMQKIDYFARQQRVKLLNSQIMKKRLNIDVFTKINKNESQFVRGGIYPLLGLTISVGGR